MKVTRASLSERHCDSHHEEERAAPENGVCSTRPLAAPSGHGRLRWILTRVTLRQKHLHSVLSAFQDSLQSRDKTRQTRQAVVAELTNLLSKCEPIISQLGSKVTWGRSFSCSSEERCHALDPSPLNIGRRDLLCHGQNKAERLSVTTFLYCQPTPYLSQIHTGLFKYIRWNVVLLRKERNGSEEDNTAYYFLCFEDVPDFKSETARFSIRRIWSIGRWVQVKPDPEKETIDDWILCKVPKGRYERLLVMGSEEPSIGAATEALSQLLRSSFSSENLQSPQNV
ncbi:UPF0575 protein C19orf67 homolog [Synchiropus splendidus]|uniref:UPF0575 protein C19orf67 homolog n=1 Tax=Synchiropus splendidus TaxID=270530 RepID=UPI00237E3AD2|nr:UPF0575 protein C19orf67 homolog [Synchiropus splendidus]XP_053713573.1 UPF0575 protein C19orf67 homolog [Synchiropus splendidus]XP_053713574.1 UPF0575 protein C19orf67 homolog [Synchiropus splendidus]